jgi:hypothetical protein
VAEQSRERQRARPLVRGIHREHQVAHVQHVAGLVFARLVQRSLQTNDHAILANRQLVRAHPAPILGEQFVVRGAIQYASVLEDERDAFALALRHRLCLQCWS